MTREVGSIELSILIETRLAIIEKDPENDIELDNNAERVILSLKKNLSELTFEEVLEAYSHLGSAPCLIYDDNGNWAIADSGYSNVRTEDDQDLEITHNVEAHLFKPSIREALEYWVNYEEA